MTDGHINRLTLAMYGEKFIKVNADVMRNPLRKDEADGRLFLLGD